MTTTLIMIKSSFRIVVFFAVLIAALSSCRNDFEFETASGNELRFSKDTVYLDTIFTNIGSSTYTLKVYNNSSNDIKIPEIKLNKGEQSGYRLMVDGQPGKSFQNVELLSKDSMFVFVETTVDITTQTAEKEFLYTDQLVFANGSQSQSVELVSLIRDAVFLYPQKDENGNTETLLFGDSEIEGFWLDENDAVNENELHWTAEKPYVIYGYAAVPGGKTLQIDAGAEVHFHASSGLLVADQAQLNIFGTVDNPVVIQGDRLEPAYENVTGQWDMIGLTVGSSANIENAIIKNANNGLWINKNDGVVNLHNVQIYNCADFGIMGVAANILGTNIVTNNCGKAGLGVNAGGDYTFVHATFANYWSRPNHTAVYLDNYDGSPGFALKARFENSIIYSGSNEALTLSYTGNNEQNFEVKFVNTLVKFFDTNNVVYGQFPYEFENNNVFENCLIARNHLTYRPFFANYRNNQMMITEEAVDLIGFGTNNTTVSVPQDIVGNTRTTIDIGAYQHVSVPEEND
ncbi:MAG TPA: right-handed parallel beta-helix repeat-containing protein [Flavobacterium sp.]|nr:right-handed parallel beta-helix repeat-containing protein [Flavobacterium sp.]